MTLPTGDTVAIRPGRGPAPREHAGACSAGGVDLRYPIVVFWSAEDGAYIAEVPDVRSCSAWGASPEAALSLAREALEDVMADANERGIVLPSPTARPTLTKAS